MSDTPRTDADNQQYPQPECAQQIRFEGYDCVVMRLEKYKVLYEHARQLERELAAMTAYADRLFEAGESMVFVASNEGLSAEVEAWQEAKESRP